MKFLKKIINFVIFFLLQINILKYPKKSLRVLMFHDISDLDNFNKQILFLKKYWTFITPDEFYKICDKKKKIDKRYLLLTFDDGFKSNLYVAQNILNKHNIKAIFFIPLQFLLIKNKIKKENFIRNNLLINPVCKNMNNMNINDVKKIISLKHKIGAHTYSHTNLKNINNKKEIIFEIISSANKLQNLLKNKIINFSFSFGRLKHISPQMLLLSKKRFNFLYTGIRGDNLNIRQLIFRDNILPADNNFDLYTYLSGSLDFLYSKERKILELNFPKNIDK